MKRTLLRIAVLILLVIMGCSPNRVVTRVSTDETTDLSGRWNDTDASLTAQEMIKDMLSRNWYSDFMSDSEREPVVIVGTVRNLSDEHIDSATFINDMERELINSGQVKFVASKAEREEIRDEKVEQLSQASEETAKRLAAETGADYMLQGSIKTITDAVDGKQAKYYQIDLQLINLETTSKEWIGTKKIKKVITQKKFGK
jgi:penicillin-binding protein activator